MKFPEPYILNVRLAERIKNNFEEHEDMLAEHKLSDNAEAIEEITKHKNNMDGYHILASVANSTDNELNKINIDDLLDIYIAKFKEFIKNATNNDDNDKKIFLLLSLLELIDHSMDGTIENTNLEINYPKTLFSVDELRKFLDILSLNKDDLLDIMNYLES